MWADSIIVELLNQRQDMMGIISFQRSNIERLHEIEYTYVDEIELYKLEVKKQKRRKTWAFFKGVGVGGIVVLILVIL